MRRGGKTSEKELQDAVKRIGAKPEAKQRARNNEEWRNFLRNVIGIRDASLDSSKGQDFWDRVQQGVKEKNKPNIVTPTEDRGRFYINPKTHYVSYRNRKGRFTSYQSVGLIKPTRVSSHAGEKTYTNPATRQVSYRDAHGKWTKSN